MQGWKTLPGSTNDVDVPHHSRVKNSTAVSKEKAMSSISVASKNCRNKAVAQKTLRIRLKKPQKSLKTLINSTFLACHLFRSPNTRKKPFA